MQSDILFLTSTIVLSFNYAIMAHCCSDHIILLGVKYVSVAENPQDSL